VDPQRHRQLGGKGAQQAAEDGTDAPDRVEGVDDRATVEPLDAQPVRVLRDVGDRVHGPGQEETQRQDDAGRGQTREEEPERRQQRRADGRSR